MQKLNQVNALLKGHKTGCEKAIDALYKMVQNPALFVGQDRVYKPYDELNGEKFPTQKQLVQSTVSNVLAEAKSAWSELWDLTWMQDVHNQEASADVIVDGKVVMSSVPVTFLLFLEKELVKVETFLSKLPVPDSSEQWKHDSNTGYLRSGELETLRTKKEPAAFEKSPATDKHPAQVEYYQKDVPVGKWLVTQFSGAIPVDNKKLKLANVKKLRDAVRVARETANQLEVKPSKVGENIFKLIYGDN